MTANTKNCHSSETEDGYQCPHCSRFVEKINVTILGKEKTVQPICECESQLEEEKIKQAQDLKQRKETERLFGISNIGKRFEESTFETYKVRPGAEKMMELSQRYINEFEEWSQHSLMIWGVPGNGKTHIAAAIANALKDKYIIVFQTFPELLGKIRNTFNKNIKESEQDIMKALLTCDLLILDDIGAEKLTDWVQDIVFRIVDGRYRRGLPILTTTNLRPKELAKQLDDKERTYDRLTEISVIIENKATSYRREIAKERLKQLSRED